MRIKPMEYLSQRLRCTDAEKDACLETVTAILRFWEVAASAGAWEAAE